MGLHLTFYPLNNQDDLVAGVVTTEARFTVTECMSLNRQLKDVSVHGARQGGIVPVVETRSALRGFKLQDSIHGPSDVSDHPEPFDVDGYGQPLTWAYAGDIAKVDLLHGYDPDIPSPFDNYHADATAALAYIRALPEDTPVVLYWF
jgi:hypothetical protein